MQYIDTWSLGLDRGSSLLTIPHVLSMAVALQLEPALIQSRDNAIFK